MDINIYTAVFQIVNTLILFFILRKILFKPVTAFLDQRRQTVKEALDQAEYDRIEAAKLKSDYELKLQEAREEARAIVERATKQAQARQDEIVREARSEAVLIRERAGSDVALQQEQALGYLRDQAADLAVAAAGQILRAEIDSTKHKSLVDRFLRRGEQH